MYIGEIRKLVPTHRDRWIQGIGTFSTRGLDHQKAFHRYQCEACGRISDVLRKADEPFYCRCQRLISVTDAPDCTVCNDTQRVSSPNSPTGFAACPNCSVDEPYSPPQYP